MTQSINSAAERKHRAVKANADTVVCPYCPPKLINSYVSGFDAFGRPLQLTFKGKSQY
jgi:hypothetical protein